MNAKSERNLAEKTMKREESIAKNEDTQCNCCIMDVELAEDTVEEAMRDEESWTDHYCEEDTYEEDIVMKEVDYYMDEKQYVAQSEENVARNEKSEDAVLNEDENQDTCELNSSQKKKESGYFEDNQEKIENIIENYVKQYGEILSIGCSVSTESNELIIDEEAGLLDQESSEQDFTSSCSTETVNRNLDDEYSKKSVFVIDDLDIMETIEIGETVEDDSMQIQCEQRDPLSNTSEAIYINRGNNVIFNKKNGSSY